MPYALQNILKLISQANSALLRIVCIAFYRIFGLCDVINFLLDLNRNAMNGVIKISLKYNQRASLIEILRRKRNKNRLQLTTQFFFSCVNQCKTNSLSNYTTAESIFLILFMLSIDVFYLTIYAIHI